MTGPMKFLAQVLGALFFLTMPLSSPAEQISHHGMTVEADGRAKDCLSCHDGMLAHSVSYCTVLCDFSTAHSLFKRYPPRGKEREFAPLGAVRAKGIKIMHGKITCISCHNLRNPKKFHLVMDNTDNRLCLSCHLEKLGH